MAAEFLASVAVESLWHWVNSAAAEVIGRRWGLIGELEKLKRSLTLIRAVLPDAEERELGNAAVSVWLEKVKDVVYDADQVFGEFVYEIHRQELEVQNRLANKLRNFFSNPNPLAFRTKMTQKVKRINVLLDDASRFGLEVVAGDRIPQMSFRLNRETCLVFLDASMVVGREGDCHAVVDLLMSSAVQEERLAVLPVLGMGGIGKTTLAKLVCKNEYVKYIFDVIIWVHVGVDFDVEGILKRMWRASGKDTGEMKLISETKMAVEEYLLHKRFLLVLDDVWNVSYHDWDRLQSFLLGIDVQIRSTIVVTTRSREVASMIGTIPSYELKPSTDEECWFIIERRVLGANRDCMPSGLENIGREIAKKCKGLPLAAWALGGLMSIKSGEEEWLSILHNDVFDSLKDTHDILPVLKLSFDRLPSSVKACFAYCSVFPKGTVMEREQLIQLWAAEGLLTLSTGSNRAMEDTGDEYFNYLVAVSLFQEGERDAFVRSCTMHDLIHDLASFVATETSILGSDSSSAYKSNVRHLYLLHDAETTTLFAKVDARKFRSLFSRIDIFGESLNLEGLRTLKLHGAHFRRLPASIGKLKLLRYFEASETEITELPDSITKLYLLQTLRLIRCRSLERFPRGLRNLVNLRHIHFTFPHQMPANIGCLTCLQSLPLFVVGANKGCEIQELECLNELRGELSVLNLERVSNGEGKKTILSGKTKLKALRLVWSAEREGSNNDDEHVLEDLEPPPSLKSLCIENYKGENFPTWLERRPLHGLEKLKLIDCMSCRQIPRLGHHPRLEFLEISGMDMLKYEEIELYSVHRESWSSLVIAKPPLFQALKKLLLHHMTDLAEWVMQQEIEADAAVFPCLEDLSIKHCGQLRSIPTSHFPSLVRLEIEDCDALSYFSGEFPKSSPLQDLRIVSCRDLASIPTLHHLTSLKRLTIEDCHTLHSLPKGLESCASLEFLSICGCAELLSIRADLGALKSLNYLEITDCPSLVCFPEDNIVHFHLQQLKIGPFSGELEAFPGLNFTYRYAPLREVRIYGWEKLKSFPDQLQCFSALESLDVVDFTSLETLPKWLCELKYLKQLLIVRCYNLKCLPNMKPLSQLRKLDIFACPNLEKRYAERSGPEWGEISHIPEVIIR